MSLYGRKTALPTRLGVKKQASVIDWDNFDESDEDSEEQCEDQQPEVAAKPTPVPRREPTSREIAVAASLHKGPVSEQQLRDEIAAKDAERAERELAAQEYASEKTSMSSDDQLQQAPSVQWTHNQRHYQHQNSISSDQLFPEQVRVGFRATVKKTFIEALDTLAASVVDDGSS